MKYSVTCADLRMMACISSRVSALALRKQPVQTGMMKREVWSLENASVERTEIRHGPGNRRQPILQRGSETLHYSTW